MRLDQAHNALEVLEQIKKHHDPKDGFTLSREQLEQRADFLSGVGVVKSMVGRADLILGLIELVKAILASRRAEVPPPPVAKPKPEPVPPKTEPVVYAEGKLESWVEEVTHDWDKESEGSGDNGWSAWGSPRWTAYTQKHEPVPPGAVIRYMSGIYTGGKATVPTGFPIIHNFRVERESGEEEFSIPSDQIAAEGTQPVPRLGHLQHSQRDWGQPEGCAITIRMNPELGPCKLSYWASAPGTGYTPADEAWLKLRGRKR